MARVLWSLGALAVALHASTTLFGVGGDEPTPLFTIWLAFGVFVLAAGTCAARAAGAREQRGTWIALATGLLVYGFGHVYYNLVFADAPPSAFPSTADLFWLALCPAGLVAITLLVRSEAKRIRPEMWLDGAIGGLAVAAIGATVLIEVVLDGALAAPAANLTFALLDLLVLGFAVGTWGLFGWRPSRTLLLLTLGFGALAVEDSVYLYQVVHGTLALGTVLDTCWLAVMLVIASGAIVSRRSIAARPASGSQLVVVPFAFALSSVALGAHLALSSDVSALNAGLNTAVLAAVVARFALTARSQFAMLAASREEALTDALTGLGNRRRLLQDLDAALAEATTEHPLLLALFDLDGFKSYNDSYGHAAGDALLSRLGQRLDSAVRGHGAAYRMGGDEFCVLMPSAHDGSERAISDAAAALTSQGEGFVVSCSYGAVLIPLEASEPAAALKAADRRMYERKYSARTSPARQSTDVLVNLMAERDGWLGPHVEETTRLCEAVARKLGVPDEDLGPLVQAAALHDVGKAAIPDAIVNKPGPLSSDERAFMRRHPAIAERVLSVAPALSRAAKLVRSSHEQPDGRGYPDGLVGDEIPLGARIIAVCDAYDAMTANRPYRTAMSSEVATAELRRCAGTQFDASVVEALCDVLAEDRGRTRIRAHDAHEPRAGESGAQR